MNIELEVITRHLRGSCVTVDNRLHGLFKLTGRDRNSSERAWTLDRGEPQNVPAGELGGRAAGSEAKPRSR
jgi:hypothetical protein